MGNKCATFPLQLHGFDVCPLNSVHFSNHTGHATFKGSVVDRDELVDIASALKANKLDTFSHILTGEAAPAPLRPFCVPAGR